MVVCTAFAKDRPHPAPKAPRRRSPNAAPPPKAGLFSEPAGNAIGDVKQSGLRNREGIPERPTWAKPHSPFGRGLCGLDPGVRSAASRRKPDQASLGVKQTPL